MSYYLIIDVQMSLARAPSWCECGVFADLPEKTGLVLSDVLSLRTILLWFLHKDDNRTFQSFGRLLF